MTLSAGSRLGPYEITAPAGAGGMGEVFRAQDTRLGREVAVKILPAEFATDADRLRRFEQEARAAAALNHPNILTIYDVGRDGDIAFIAMECVEGQTLRALMAHGRVPVTRTIQIAQQIAEGLAKAHAAGIVHRDLKPENVMVTADGLVKIVDFGIAKLGEPEVAGSDSKTRTLGTSPGIVLGSPGYMSPEQASGSAVDYRSDQFSLGLLIYELATGTRPFQRQTTAQSMAATIEAEPTPIDALNPGVPPHLGAIVARCLAKDPAERYESTRDLARDLKSVADTGSRSAAIQAPTVPRRRLLYVAAAVLLLIGIGSVAGWSWYRARGPVERPRPLIVVRPFRSLSADPAQGYFAAGVTEEIRGQLSQVSALRLLSRNAIDSSPGADVSRRLRDLGVTGIVDGSVRVDGKRVRVTAELADAATQQTLWSDQYDRELADILAVQSDVAVQIARALRANLSPDEQKRLGQRPTANAEAYTLYLQSQSLPSLERAKNLAGIDLLRRALALDPTFALAQADIGFRFVAMAYYDDASNIDKAVTEAESAIRLNPSLPLAYYVLGTAYTLKGNDAQARLSFLRALELDPNNGDAMANLSILEAAFGRLDESLQWARRLFGLGGRSGNSFYHVFVPLLSLRADAELCAWMAEGERRLPRFYRIATYAAFCDLFQGRTADAQARLARATAQFPENEEVKFVHADIAFLTGASDLQQVLDALSAGADGNTAVIGETIGLRRAYAAGLGGDAAKAAMLRDKAEGVARVRMDKGDRTPSLRIEMAAVAAMRGDYPAALEWLDRAYDVGYRDYGLLERDPIITKIAPAEKLRDVLDRMRRDVDVQRARARQNGLLDMASLLAPAK